MQSTAQTGARACMREAELPGGRPMMGPSRVRSLVVADHLSGMWVVDAAYAENPFRAEKIHS